LEAHRDGHPLALVYRTLLSAPPLQQPADAWLSGRTGLPLVTVRRTLYLLEKLALLRPVTRGRNSIPVVLLNPSVLGVTLATVRFLKMGGLALNLRDGSLLLDGEEHDLQSSMPKIVDLAVQVCGDTFTEPVQVCGDTCTKSMQVCGDTCSKIAISVPAEAEGVGFFPSFSSPYYVITVRSNSYNVMSNKELEYNNLTLDTTNKSMCGNASIPTNLQQKVTTDTRKHRTELFAPSLAGLGVVKKGGDQQNDQASAPRKKAAKSAGVPANSDEREFLDWVWNRWLTVMGYESRKLRLGTARAKLALARFREGHTRDEFDAVLTWASTDPWLRGTDPKSTRAYDDFDTLFRPGNFEKYLKRSGDHRRVDNRTDVRLAPSSRPVTVERM